MKKILIFLVVLSLILFGIDRVVGSLLFKVNDYVKSGNNVGGKLNCYLANNKGVNTVFLGDSRIEYGLIPDSVGTGNFNLAHHGKVLDFNSSLLAILKAENKLPKNVILSIDPYHFLDSEEYTTFNSSISLRQYYDEVPLVKKYINNSDDKYISLKWKSYLYRYNSAVPTLFLYAYKTMKGATIEDKGFDHFDKTDEDSLRVTVSSKSKVDNILKYSDKVTASKIDVLKDVLEQCKKNKTNLVLIIAPTKYTVKEKYNIGLNAIKPIIKQFKVRLIDFNDKEKISVFNDISLWFDADHLNLDGAKVFSKCLKNELRKTNEE